MLPHDLETQKDLALLLEQGRWIMRELSALRKELNDLRDFKWKIVGFSACAAFIVSALIEIARASI